MKFPKLVIEEAKKLKKFSTIAERSRLSFYSLHPEKGSMCIYGQMTGFCYSERASELIKKSCKRVYIKVKNKQESEDWREDYVGKNVKLNGEPKEGGHKRWGVWFSPIEVFISKAYKKHDTDSLRHLVGFLKGEIKTLS